MAVIALLALAAAILVGMGALVTGSGMSSDGGDEGAFLCPPGPGPSATLPQANIDVSLRQGHIPCCRLAPGDL